MEVTERAVARDPAGLLAAVARARAVGWGVALDDVGAAPGSLAVLPFVHPDVIKLDLRLVQGRTTAEVARIVNAVRAKAERTGARILAEGIETRRHLEIARALGATVGQGWLYGRPGPLPEATRPPRIPLDLLPEPAAVEDQTPFEVVSAERVPERAPKDLLLSMSMHIEDKGLDAAEPGVLLACFQEARHFTPGTRARFGLLAGRAALTGALGAGMPAAPAPGSAGPPSPPATPCGASGPWSWSVPTSPPPWSPGTAATTARRPTAGSTSSSPTTATWSSGPPSRCWTGSPRRADRSASGSGSFPAPSARVDGYYGHALDQ